MVRPIQGHDLVLARLVDHDERDAGLGVHAAQPGQVDPVGFQRRAQPVAELVAAAGADEAHLGAHPPGRDRLVPALAARRVGKPVAEIFA